MGPQRQEEEVAGQLEMAQKLKKQQVAVEVAAVAMNYCLTSFLLLVEQPSLQASSWASSAEFLTPSHWVKLVS